jgi:hypothetical protein
MFLGRRARHRAPFRPGGCRARPQARRRLPAGQEPAPVSPDRRPGPLRATVRRGDRLHRTIRRPPDQLPLAQPRRLACPGHGRHPRRPGSPGSRGARRTADRIRGHPHTRGHRPGAARGGRPRQRPVRVRGRPADRPPDWEQQRHGRRYPLPGVPGGRRRRLEPQLRGTAPRRPFRTGRARCGRSSTRATAGTASTKPARTWAVSSWSGPTPKAWRSASRKPSTWPSEDRVRPDRCWSPDPERS